KSPRVPVPSLRSPILPTSTVSNNRVALFVVDGQQLLIDRASPARQSKWAVAARDELFETPCGACMSSPTNRHRLERDTSAFVCAASAWLGVCGCQSAQFDRLDGSTTPFGSGQAPVVDNAQPSSRPSAH